MIPQMIIKIVGDWVAKHLHTVTAYIAGVLTVVLLLVVCYKPAPVPVPLPPIVKVEHDSVKVVIDHWDTLTKKVPIYITEAKKKSPILFTLDTTIDSEITYQGSIKEDDSAYIKFELTSSQLPTTLPPDLKSYITYLPAPKITTTITHIDTTTLYKPQPVPYNDTWTTVKACAWTGVICGVLGVGLGIYLLH